MIMPWRLLLSGLKTNRRRIVAGLRVLRSPAFIAGHLATRIPLQVASNANVGVYLGPPGRTEFRRRDARCSRKELI